VISNLQSAVRYFKAMKMHTRLSEVAQTNKVGDIQNYFSSVNIVYICLMFSNLHALIYDKPMLLIMVHVRPISPNHLVMQFDTQ